MSPLTVFLDCEFADFIQSDRVSIALVCEDGREFYAERSDFGRRTARRSCAWRCYRFWGTCPGQR